MDTPSFPALAATRPAATPAVHDLASFNAAPAEQLTTLLTFMTACRELARTIVVGRPYLRITDVYSTATRSLDTLPLPLITGIVNVHRPIDQVPMIEDATTAGLLTTEQISELREAALGYAAVHGHLFIADPDVWGSAEAVAMVPLSNPNTAPPIGDVFTRLLADVDARSIASPAKAWALTIAHLERSNQLKLMTLLGEE